MPRAERRRTGAMLLEVIVALAILGAVAGSATVLATSATHLLRGSRARDEEVRAASAFLDRVALWPREDLDRRLGEREQGQWRLEIRREWPTLYAVELRDSAGAAPVLSTVLYRPVPPMSPRSDAAP